MGNARVGKTACPQRIVACATKNSTTSSSTQAQDLQYSSINAIVAADFVIVATTGDRSDVDGTKRMLAELYNLFEKKTGLVLNKVLDASATAKKTEMAQNQRHLPSAAAGNGAMLLRSPKSRRQPYLRRRQTRPPLHQNFGGDGAKNRDQPNKLTQKSALRPLCFSFQKPSGACINSAAHWAYTPAQRCLNTVMHRFAFHSASLLTHKSAESLCSDSTSTRSSLSETQHP